MKIAGVGGTLVLGVTDVLGPAVFRWWSTLEFDGVLKLDLTSVSPGLEKLLISLVRVRVLDKNMAHRSPKAANLISLGSIVVRLTSNNILEKTYIFTSCTFLQGPNEHRCV